MATGYKSASGGGPRKGPIVAAVIVVAAAVAAGFLGGRLTGKPDTKAEPPTRMTLRYEDGVPLGFPNTARGAGNAAAAYVTVRGTWRADAPDTVRRRLERIVVPGNADLVTKLMPAPSDHGNPNFAHATPLLVWTSAGNSDDLVAEGTVITAKVYTMATIGARLTETTAAPAAGSAGLSGGFGISTIGLKWAGGTWRITSYEMADAPPVNIDPAGQNAQMPPELLGRDARVPGIG